MNIFFSLALFASLAFLTYHSPDKSLGIMLQGLEKSLTFGITLFASYGVWMSTLKIWEKCGINKKICKTLSPFIKKLFPGENNTVNESLAVNLSANILGMGGIATPAGKNATNAMKSRKNRIMLGVISGTSIQILPTTILALRSSSGATTDILLPSIITSIVTTAIGAMMVKLFVRE